MPHTLNISVPEISTSLFNKDATVPVTKYKAACYGIVANLLLSTIVFEGSQTTSAGKMLNRTDLSNYINSGINKRMSLRK